MKYNPLASIVAAMVLAINISFVIHVTIAQAAEDNQGLLKPQPSKTVGIKVPADKTYGDVVQLIDVVKEVGAQAIEVQNDFLDHNQQPQQGTTVQGGNPPLIAAVR